MVFKRVLFWFWGRNVILDEHLLLLFWTRPPTSTFFLTFYPPGNELVCYPSQPALLKMIFLKVGYVSFLEKRLRDRLWWSIPHQKFCKIFRRAPLWKPIANHWLAMQIACKMCFTKKHNLYWTILIWPWSSPESHLDGKAYKFQLKEHRILPNHLQPSPSSHLKKKKHHSMYSPKTNGWNLKMPPWKKEPHLKFEMKYINIQTWITNHQFLGGFHVKIFQGGNFWSPGSCQLEKFTSWTLQTSSILEPPTPLCTWVERNETSKPRDTKWKIQPVDYF